MIDEIDKLLAERGKVHGDFTTHAEIAQELKTIMGKRPGWHKLTPSQREALEMIQHKVGRILNGDPNHRDHWEDVAGYARLAAQRCYPMGTQGAIVAGEWAQKEAAYLQQAAFQGQLRDGGGLRPSNDGITYPGRRVRGDDYNHGVYTTDEDRSIK